MIRRKIANIRSKQSMIPLYTYSGNSGSKILIIRLSTSIYLSSDSYISNTKDYVTEDNFELVYTRLGEIPTFKVGYEANGVVSVTLTSNNDSSRAYLYKFVLNDMVMYMGFGNSYNLKDVVKEYGINISLGDNYIPVFIIEQ